MLLPTIRERIARILKSLHTGFDSRFTLRRFASAICSLLLSIRALAFSINHLLAIQALITPFASLPIEYGALQAALEANSLGAGNIMALTTAVPFSVDRPLETGTRWATGTVFLVSTQAENLVGAGAAQASSERSIRPCHSVAVEGVIVANIFHWDLLSIRKLGA